MELVVTGITCGHCEAAVQRAVAAVDAGAEVRIDRESGRVAVSGDASPERIAAAIRAEGYDVRDPA